MLSCAGLRGRESRYRPKSATGRRRWAFSWFTDWGPRASPQGSGVGDHGSGEAETENRRNGETERQGLGVGHATVGARWPGVEGQERRAFFASASSSSRRWYRRALMSVSAAARSACGVPTDTSGPLPVPLNLRESHRVLETPADPSPASSVPRPNTLLRRLGSLPPCLNRAVHSGQCSP
jgi:hypothetical protein